MKKVSVIIPCYNAVKWLPKCFMSLVGQSIGIDNLELIFVNDASTDDGQTWNMLNEIEKAYPESIIIIDLPHNRRQGGARNEGLKYASGEYIAFVDADDWVEPEFCAFFYDNFKNNPDVQIISSAAYINKNNEEIENPFWNGEKKYFTGKEKEEMAICSLHFNCDTCSFTCRFI